MTTERRLAAIMFTDIAGYSALTQRDEALALELLAEHFQLLRPVIAQHQGREIKTIGDSFMVEFASPLEALRCALAMQGTLNTRNLVCPKDRQIQIRIGIHLGEVEERDDDLFGDGVNIAARIEPLAEPGGICVTRSVHDQAVGKIESEFESLGTPELKNIATPIEAFKVLLPWSRSTSPRPPRHLQTVKSSDGPAPTYSIAVLPFSSGCSTSSSHAMKNPWHSSKRRRRSLRAAGCCLWWQRPAARWLSREWVAGTRRRRCGIGWQRTLGRRMCRPTASRGPVLPWGNLRRALSNWKRPMKLAIPCCAM